VTEGNPRGGGLACRRSNALVGVWEMEATFPGDPPIVMKGGQCAIEPILGGRFLLMHTQIDAPTAPDSTYVIAVDSDGGGYTQHYLDERGVVRLSAMTLDAGYWTLTREAPDFSPLDFRIALPPLSTATRSGANGKRANVTAGAATSHSCVGDADPRTGL